MCFPFKELHVKTFLSLSRMQCPWTKPSQLSISRCRGSHLRQATKPCPALSQHMVTLRSSLITTSSFHVNEKSPEWFLNSSWAWEACWRAAVVGKGKQHSYKKFRFNIQILYQGNKVNPHPHHHHRTLKSRTGQWSSKAIIYNNTWIYLCVTGHGFELEQY